ncbi:UDP-N-acetylglucosamine 2-epimerase [Bradyrhizobium sp. LM3.2]
MRKHFFILLGTRPEAIKLFPVINRLKAEKSKDVTVTICATAQHRHLLDQVPQAGQSGPGF